MRYTRLAIGILSIALGVVGLQYALAANGDNLRQIIADRTGTACASIDEDGNHLSVGVGIAFDGTKLLISCYSDNTITEIDPADGSQIAVHTISGASYLGAMAWDAVNSKLWACSDFGTVGTVDLALDTFTPAFSTYAVVFPGGAGSGSGCFDGLAYDGVDDTVWASGDVSSTVEHYTSGGAPVSKTTVLGLLGLIECFGGPCGNSGIAVGGPKLYLANNGGSQIYETPKDFSAVSLFSSFPRRLEDLECDPVTFTGDGVGAIWSIDAYDNVLNAWEIPLGQCGLGGVPTEICGDGIDNDGDGLVDEDCPVLEGRMTGGGSIGDSTVRHGFELHCDATTEPNRLEVNWGKGAKFHLETLLAASCTDDPTIAPNPPAAGFDTYHGKGLGRYNGVSGYTAKWTFTDAGEPGVADYATISIVDPASNPVLTVSGTLKNGNQQAHAD